MPHLPVPLRGPLWIVLASVFFAAGWAFIKLAGETVHPFQVVFFRCIIGAAFLAPLILSRRIELSAARFGGHALRATAGLIVMFATFYALANAPISTVQAISFSAPIFASIGAILVLGEVARRGRLIALGVGFAGVLVVLQPWSEPLTVALGLALIGALAHAMASLVVKRLTASDRPMTIVAWSFILPIIPAFAASLFVWTWPDAEGWFYVTGVGLFMLAGQCSMVRALSIADATAIMPFEFVRFGFIIAIGVVLFAEMVAMETFAGGALILVSAIYLAIREARRDRTTALVPAARLPADG